MRVKSSVDLSISIIFGLTILIIIVSMIIIPQDFAVIGYVTGIPITIFLIWTYFGTYYELKDEYLYCKSGPFFERIPYNKIKSIKPCQNMLSSMALSRKRIEIKQHSKGYFAGTTLISPKNRDNFMEQLIKRCHNLD